MLVAAITAPMAILFDAISFVCSAISVWLIRKPEPRPEPSAAPHIGREIMEGLRASWHEPILRTLLLRSATVLRFVGFGGSLYILFAVRELKIGAVLLGVVIAVGGCSGVFGALAADAPGAALWDRPEPDRRRAAARRSRPAAAAGARTGGAMRGHAGRGSGR